MKVTRREFLRAAAGMAGVLGLEASGLLKLQEVLAASGAPSVIWLQGQSCTGCSVSFLNSIHYATVDDLLLNSINLEYHPNVMAAAGDFAISAAQVARPSTGELKGLNSEWLNSGQDLSFDLNGDGIVNFIDYALVARRGYILVIEGAIPVGSDGHFCHIGGEMSMIDALRVFSAHASQIITVGTCAAYGGIPAAGSNPTDAMGVEEALNHIGQPQSVINIPGCPIHPDWLVGTVVSILTGQKVNLDDKGRPLSYFGKKIHDTGNCPYKEEPKAHTLGMPGYCLKDIGCNGPETYCDSFVRQWNSPAKGQNGVNWCISAGSPCIGCTEPKFPDGMSPFYRLSEFHIKKAEYKIAEQEFRVEAISIHQPDDVLTLEGYGQMPWKGSRNKYEYRVKPVGEPGNSVTVTSSRLGKSVSKSIEYKD
jgi:hydrogenase small subunit